MITRQSLLRTTLAVTLSGWAATASAQQPKEVTIALIQPLSGPWARLGELSRKGAEVAVEDVNNAGGIKALGGAKLRLVVADGGDAPDKFKNAAQRLLSQEPDIVGGIGAYVSSFTLAVTEVTERAGVPWLTLSYAPSITGRGFKHVFATSPTADQQAVDGMPAILALAEEATGKKPKTTGIVMDNTPSPVGFTKNMRDGGLKKSYGLDLTVDEQFTPPLSDAAALMQKVRAARPEFLLLLLTATPDIKLTMEKLTEVGLPRSRMPVVNNGGVLGSPDLLRVMGKDILEGSLFITANWGAKGQEAFIEDFKKRTGELWITQDSISNYGHVMLLAAALEKAGAADRAKVSQAMHELDLTDGAAKFFPGGRVKFSPNGLRENAPTVIVQWQNGVPVTVFPPSAAQAKAVWPKS